MKLKLPSDVVFDHDLRLMIFRPRSVLNEKVVDEIVAFLEKIEASSDKPFNRYSDLSQLEGIDLNFDYVYRISLHRRLTFMHQPPVKSAFFVTTEEAAHIIDIHILMTDHSPLQVAMFRDVPAAAQWLNVSPEDLEIGEESESV